MLKINPNLLDLQHLLMNGGKQTFYLDPDNDYKQVYTIGINPGQVFVAYFCNYMMNGGTMANILNANNVVPPYAYMVEGGSNTLIQLMNLNQLAGNPFNQVQLGNLGVSFLNTIYNLFKYSIPYQQTNDNVQVTLQMFYTGFASDNGSSGAPMQSDGYLPNQLLQSIDAYFGLYAQDIFQYFLRITVQLRQWSLVQTTYTVKHTRNEGVNEQTGSNTTNQTSGISQTSFNPVSNTTNVTIPTINVGTSQIPGTSDNTIPSNQAFTNENTASYNTHGSGSNNNFKENQQRSVNESYQTQDLNAYKNIGMQDVTQALKPLIYKLSTLFGTLGNDEFPANSMWGFNIG